MLYKNILKCHKKIENRSPKMIRRRGAARDPVHQIGVGLPHQGLQLIELFAVETLQVGLSESTEQQVALLGAPMPGLIEEAFASDGEVIHLGSSVRARQTSSPASDRGRWRG